MGALRDLRASLRGNYFADRPISSGCLEVRQRLSPELATRRSPSTVKYEINLPPPSVSNRATRRALHSPKSGTRGRQIDHNTEEFVNGRAMGVADWFTLGH